MSRVIEQRKAEVGCGPRKKSARTGTQKFLETLRLHERGGELVFQHCEWRDSRARNPCGCRRCNSQGKATGELLSKGLSSARSRSATDSEGRLPMSANLWQFVFSASRECGAAK